MENAQKSATKHVGSCHCGAVRFEAIVDLSDGGSRCNCSICTKLSSFGAVVKPDAFKLLQGADDLSTYVWRTKTSIRYFCKHCGVHCYGAGDVPELGGAFISINLAALDDVDPNTLKVVHWDGRHENWHSGTRDTPWPIYTA